MKNKGFTLVELIAVIVILSLLALVTGVSIVKLLKDSKEDLSSAQVTLIKSAAEAWVVDNLSKIPEKNECKYITLNDLKEYGLLSEDIIDPNSNKKISDSLKIKLSSSNGKSVKIEVGVDDIKGCEWGLEKLTYKDSSGANRPDLMNGALVPVKYIKDHWEIADPEKKWYDYEKQEWANAVILKEGVSTEVGTTLKLPTLDEYGSVYDTTSDVIAMFVWIPRYSYTISSKAKGERSTCESSYTYPPQQYDCYMNPQAIDIKFVSSSIKENGVATYTSDNPSNWYTPPAFTFGEEELSGIWVGKFETGILDYDSDDDSIYIIPNIQSGTNGNVYTLAQMFTVSRQYNSYLSNFGDSHAAKNSEWGVAAYLTQSKYGKYGNPNYDSSSNEVVSNGMGITGRAGGIPWDISDNPDHGYSYETIGGQAASTTGNVYGIYDMNGGKGEYVMGFVGDTNGNFYSGVDNNHDNTGFNGPLVDGTEYTDGIELPDSKYYDLYNSKMMSNSYKGHALWETKGWYSDEVFCVGPGEEYEHTWLVRGGYASSFIEIAAQGIFNVSNSISGDSDYGLSFRVIISPTRS